MTRDVLRRQVLKKGLFGGFLLAASGAGWLGFRPHGNRLQVLTALAKCWVPEHAVFPSSRALQTAQACERVIALTDEATQTELTQLLSLFENALPNFLFGLRPRPFTQLGLDEQQRVLAEWRDSRLSIRKTGYLALRGLVMAAYYGDAATWSAVGYPGPPPGIHQPQAPVWKGGGAPHE